MPMCAKIDASPDLGHQASGRWHVAIFRSRSHPAVADTIIQTFGPQIVFTSKAAATPGTNGPAPGYLGLELGAS
jgi:hypothetical protein